MLAKDHLESKGLSKGWQWKQVQKLCQFEGITEYELFAIYGISYPRFKRFREKASVPPEIAIHFHIRMGWLIERKLGTPPAPVVPPILA